jgi:hypothetical protein
MIESAEEFATLKKGDKPVRSPPPRCRFAPFFHSAKGPKT